MFGRRSSIVLIIGIAVLVAATAPPVFAIYPQLSTTLTGPAINGVVPGGDAKVDQSKLPTQPGTVDVQVNNVNLPDGTVLGVVLTDCGSSPVGTITLRRGDGQLKTKLPVGCQIGRQSSIFVNNGSATILSGGAPWTVGG
jgi:hypothetical protein